MQSKRVLQGTTAGATVGCIRSSGGGSSITASCAHGSGEDLSLLTWALHPVEEVEGFARPSLLGRDGLCSNEQASGVSNGNTSAPVHQLHGDPGRICGQHCVREPAVGGCDRA